MIERILRYMFKAPTVVATYEEDKTLPQYAVAVPELFHHIIGVEPGEEGWLESECVTVYAGDTPVASSFLIGYLGNGPHSLRRRVIPRLLRHLIGGAWTLAGMTIVVLTLSGAMQVLALLICVLFFVIDLMSISLRKP